MTFSLGMITIDTADAHALGQWWADAFDGEIVFETVPYFTMVKIPGIDLVIGFQGVEEPTPGKNRVHMDLAASDRPAAVKALIAKGAKHIGDHAVDGDGEWTVLEDPDGNQFCLTDECEH